MDRRGRRHGAAPGALLQGPRKRGRSLVDRGNRPGTFNRSAVAPDFLKTLCILLVFSGLALARPADADPLAEIAGVSDLGRMDGRRLQNGEIWSRRGTQGSFARGVYLESCFYVKAPPATVQAALLQWDPSKHPDDEVAAYQTFRSAGGVDFSRLTALDRKRPADRWMLEQSRAVAEGKPSELHLTLAEQAIFRSEATASAAWNKVLQRRAKAVTAGGLAAAGGYLAGDLKIEPPGEFRSLLGMTPMIAARFAGAERADVTGYAEQGLTQGHTSFSLGLLSWRQGAQSWQVVDCTYYPSDTYLLSANLCEIWPWEGGALVWQIDYVSAPFRAYARGLDKVFAGREMIKETRGSIDRFRRSVEGPGASPR